MPIPLATHTPTIAIDVPAITERPDVECVLRAFFTRGEFPIFFHRDTEGVTRIAAGCAERLDARGSEWREEWSRVVHHEWAAPDGSTTQCWLSVFFDPDNDASPQWRAFPARSVILPRFFLTVDDTSAVLRIAGSSDERGQAFDTWNDLAKRRPEPPGDLPPLESVVTWNDGSYHDAVMETLRRIANGEAVKIVAAREARLAARRAFRPLPILRALLASRRDNHVLLVSMDGDTHFVSASPERLVRVDAGRLSTAAIAGTVPRGSTPEEERRQESDLLTSGKLRDEQDYVTRMIRESLEPICDDIDTSRRDILRLPDLLHLRTPVQARMRAGRSFLDAVAALHPTPAVAGTPRDMARTLIRKIECFDRGLYAGVLGWMNTAGDGDSVVAIRSALIHGGSATLYAGAGIIDRSEPEQEVQETRLKMQALLRAFEHG
jgi:isochorismate synthase